MRSCGCSVVRASLLVGLFWLLKLSYGQQELPGPLGDITNKEEFLRPLEDKDSDPSGNIYYPKKKEFESKLPPLSCVSNNTNSCSASDFNNPHGIIRCQYDDFSITPCYCLDDKNIIGYCQFTCFRQSFLIAPNLQALINDQCSPFNRKGMFCGQCNNGTAYPAYSFSLKCVSCESDWRNVVKYIAVAYVPLTVFLILLMVFRISVNSAPLLGYIFVAQTCSVPFQMRLGMSIIEVGHVQKYQSIGVRILGSVYGIWNLDFFRVVLKPFCLHPNWNTIEVMCLEYIISSYPFILILLTYTIVEFYSRGYKMFCWWKPFHWCLTRLKNEMNIKTSLVDAFATFFSLSYSKTLNTTFDILAFTKTWTIDDIHTNQGSRSYYAATEDKPPLAILLLSVSIFVVFNLLPIIVLLLYSIQTPPDDEDVGGFIQPLINTLLNSYRDGRDGRLNCRFFCVVYLIARIFLFVALLISPNIFFQFMAAIVFLVIGMLVAVIRPYKYPSYNTVDTLLMLSLALSYIGVASYYFVNLISPASIYISVIFVTVVCNIPLLYLVALILNNAVRINRIPQRLINMVVKILSRLKTSLNRLLAKVNVSPQHQVLRGVRPAGTMYVAIESGTVRVSNVDLSQ